MSIGFRLQSLRCEYNFSVESVAQFLDITPSLLNDFEEDKKTLTLSQLEMFCDLYAVDEEYILENKKKHSLVKFDADNLSVDATYKMNRLVRNLEFLSSMDN